MSDFTRHPLAFEIVNSDSCSSSSSIIIFRRLSCDSDKAIISKSLKREVLDGWGLVKPLTCSSSLRWAYWWDKPRHFEIPSSRRSPPPLVEKNMKYVDETSLTYYDHSWHDPLVFAAALRRGLRNISPIRMSLVYSIPFLQLHDLFWCSLSKTVAHLSLNLSGACSVFVWFSKSAFYSFQWVE